MQAVGGVGGSSVLTCHREGRADAVVVRAFPCAFPGATRSARSVRGWLAVPGTAFWGVLGAGIAISCDELSLGQGIQIADRH